MNFCILHNNTESIDFCSLGKGQIFNYTVCFCDIMPRELKPKRDLVIPEVSEAYRILAKYSFDEKISLEDKNRVLELLGKVSQGSPNYDKLQTAIAAINVSEEGRTAARALKDYMIECGKDPGKISDLNLESQDRYRGGHGAEVWG